MAVQDRGSAVKGFQEEKKFSSAAEFSRTHIYFTPLVSDCFQNYHKKSLP